jgi:putative ABC transport system substrate-binding protein
MNARMPHFWEGLFSAADRNGPEIEIVPGIAEGKLDQLPPLAAKLVTSEVQVIFAVSPPAVHAARSVTATATIPIVAHDLESDPIANGWAASIARPGGNLTGLFLDVPDVSVKCLQLLQEVSPGRKIAVLWDPATGSLPLDAVKAATATLGADTEIVEVRRLDEVDALFRRLGGGRIGGLLMLSTPVVGTNLGRVAGLALEHKLPAITLFAEFAQGGGLLSYGPDVPSMYRQAGLMTRKILRGANPAEIPIERPARFILVVNLKAAKALGVEIPTSILLRADEVIE